MGYIKTSSKQANGEAVELYYQDFGTGKPVVLIHGWPMSLEMWEYQQEALLNAGLRVIAYDRRGFGRSTRVWEGYDYDTFASDLNDLLTQLDLQDVALAGFSMGGGEVARYMSRYNGARVSKAIFIGSVVPFLLKTADHPEGAPQEVFDGMIAGIRKDRIAFLQEFGKTFFGVKLMGSPISQASLEYYRNLCSVASPKGTIDCVTAFGTTDFRPDLPSIKVPTLFIHGDDDQIVPLEVTSRKAQEAIAGSELIVYEGAPHGLWFTHAERLTKDLLRFLLK
ncbi:MAG: alpha/beta hydrolase [Chitinophagales bacterium]|nr:alpha/beta hydrolase [Chitinophagales bacterium]